MPNKRKQACAPVQPHDGNIVSAWNKISCAGKTLPVTRLIVFCGTQSVSAGKLFCLPRVDVVCKFYNLLYIKVLAA
jgi:hypothetical protein